MNAPQCTPRSPATQRVGAVSRRSRVPEQYATLCLLKLRVPLDKLFRAATGETHRHAAVFVVPLDANDGSHTEARMTNLPSQHGIAIAAALHSGAAEGALSRLAARGCFRPFRPAAHATQEFFRRIRILRVGLVAPRLANFRHGSTNRVNQLGGNFRKKA